MLLSTPPDVTVDLVTTPDPACYREIHRVLAATVALGGAVGWPHVPTEEETAGWLDGEFAAIAAGRAGLAIARLAGRVEALGAWGFFEPPVIAVNAEVRKVMVHPDARGHGLARLVVLALERDMAAHGVEIAVLDVRGNNHGAIALYESLGWREHGRLPDFVAIGSERWDMVGMHKRITAPSGVVRHGSSAVGPGASSRR